MRKLWINLVAALMIFTGGMHLTRQPVATQPAPGPAPAEKVAWCDSPPGSSGCTCWSADGDVCWGDWCMAGSDWCTWGVY